ncbi:MAG TPA: pentapeptide repeat-containing protein, partial [Thermoleophilia bacterium]|nr:pentapeptide repeat-containing protein [Thermoleophilia bacterium]
AQLEISGGFDGLRGAVIDSGQLVDLAPALAAALGITVKDR